MQMQSICYRATRARHYHLFTEQSTIPIVNIDTIAETLIYLNVAIIIIYTVNLLSRLWCLALQNKGNHEYDKIA